MKKINYVIVGQGLAGTILSQMLLKHGRSIIIIDAEGFSNTSRVAAGLYNPVVFKRLVKSWLADELIPFMNEFYSESEKLLGTKFYFKKHIIKPFAEDQEKVLWLKKTKEDVGRYLSKYIYDDFLNDIIYNPLGASEIIEAGNLDTTVFLNAFKGFFEKSNCLMKEKFEYDKLIISEDGVNYKNIYADKIIFCEGHKALDNPYFSWLPFKLTKGETLTIKLNEAHIIPLDKVINKGIFILPLGNNIYKVGATYEWEDLTEFPTEKGKADLLDKLRKVLKVPFDIIDHQAGIRPTVNDRRPLIGLHPKHRSLGIFNGLGTKGVMLAPFFARQFVSFLEDLSPLNKEVNIDRFK